MNFDDDIIRLVIYCVILCGSLRDGITDDGN